MSTPRSSGGRIRLHSLEEWSNGQTQVDVYVESITFPPKDSPSEANLRSVYLRTSSSLFSLVQENYSNTSTRLHTHLTDAYQGQVDVTIQGTTLRAVVSVHSKKVTAFQCDQSSGSLLRDIQELLITKEVLERLNVNHVVLGVSVEHKT